MLVFHYRTDSELCSAATAHRGRRHVPNVGGPLERIRRQVASDRNEMSQELVDAILAYEDKLVKQISLISAK